MSKRGRGGRRLSDADYARLLTIRTAIRRFEQWSAAQAAEHGVTASQHQLLLAVRAHPERQGPTIGQVAQYLFIRHHSAVELANRSVHAGLVTRAGDDADRRVVRLRLADSGSQILDALSGAHLAELASLTPLFESLLEALNGG